MTGVVILRITGRLVPGDSVQVPGACLVFVGHAPASIEQVRIGRTCSDTARNIERALDAHGVPCFRFGRTVYLPPGKVVPWEVAP